MHLNSRLRVADLRQCVTAALAGQENRWDQHHADAEQHNDMDSHAQYAGRACKVFEVHQQIRAANS